MSHSLHSCMSYYYRYQSDFLSSARSLVTAKDDNSNRERVSNSHSNYYYRHRALYILDVLFFIIANHVALVNEGKMTYFGITYIVIVIWTISHHSNMIIHILHDGIYIYVAIALE